MSHTPLCIRVVVEIMTFLLHVISPGRMYCLLERGRCLSSRATPRSDILLADRMLLPDADINSMTSTHRQQSIYKLQAIGESRQAL